MNPGELNCRLDLYHEEKVDDGQGGYDTSYPETPYANPWAKIETILARQVDEYGQMRPEQQHLVTIRYRGDVIITDRAVFRNRIFEQISPPVNVDQKNAYLRLLCREVVADADAD